MRSLAVCATLLACTGCTQLYRVLDSSTDQPIAGAEAHVIITYYLPIGVGHPANMTAGEWRLVSDSKGEFSICHPSADSADVDLRKAGYRRLRTAKEFRQTMTRKTGDTILLYLTPPEDEVLEEIRFFLELSLFDVEHKKRYSGDLSPYPPIVSRYAQARLMAKSPREWHC